MKVKYNGKIYKVLKNHFFFQFDFYKLASNFSGGAPFAALKSKCEII